MASLGRVLVVDDEPQRDTIELAQFTSAFFGTPIDGPITGAMSLNQRSLSDEGISAPQPS
jgi:hypothetical protein